MLNLRMASISCPFMKQGIRLRLGAWSGRLSIPQKFSMNISSTLSLSTNNIWFSQSNKSKFKANRHSKKRDGNENLCRFNSLKNRREISTREAQFFQYTQFNYLNFSLFVFIYSMMSFSQFCNHSLYPTLLNIFGKPLLKSWKLTTLKMVCITIVNFNDSKS